MTDLTCQKWFVKFCAGDCLLEDAPWSGRPVEFDSDQTETLIENNLGDFWSRWQHQADMACFFARPHQNYRTKIYNNQPPLKTVRN